MQARHFRELPRQLSKAIRRGHIVEGKKLDFGYQLQTYRGRDV